MSDSVEENLASRRLNSLNGILSGCAVQQHVQFRHFGNPTPIDFTIEFDPRWTR